MHMTATPPKSLTPDDLLAMGDDVGFELVDGKLSERAVGMLSCWVAGELLFMLSDHCRKTSQGWVFPADSGYRCFGDRNANVRKPDVSVVLRGRFPNEQLPLAYSEIPPDFAAEVISPADLVSQLDEKTEVYLRDGVRLVWIFNPQTRTARVHRPDGTITRLTEDQDHYGESVLPGFRCKLSNIFPPVSQAATPTTLS